MTTALSCSGTFADHIWQPADCNAQNLEFTWYFISSNYCLFIYIYIYIYIYILARQSPSGPWPPPHSRGSLWFLDHTQRRTTVGRTSLDE